MQHLVMSTSQFSSVNPLQFSYPRNKNAIDGGQWKSKTYNEDQSGRQRRTQNTQNLYERQAHTIYNNYKKSKITSQKEEGADSFRIVDSPRGVNSNEKERENRRKRDEDGRFRVRFTWRPLTLSFLSFSLCVPQALLKREIK